MVNVREELGQLLLDARHDRNNMAYAIENLVVRLDQQNELAKQAWVKTFTGKRLYAFDPKPEQICLEDIAHALSKNNRFTGHCPINYTVGLHSLHVYEVLRRLGESPETCLMGLIHDGSEAYLQDIAKPFKQFLPDYQEVEELLQNMIYLKYLGYVPTSEQYSVVKMVDEILLVNEIEQLMPEDDDWFIPDVPRIHVDVTNIYPTNEYLVCNYRTFWFW
jgi:uncharacterized protein